jgi:hypothetical protein
LHSDPKLRGQPAGKVSPLSRLKELCLKKPEARDELWAWRKEPELTNAAIRGRIEARWGITLSRDGQLSEFWPWLRMQVRTANFNSRVAEFEEWYQGKNPEATAEKIRQAGIAFFLTEAASEGDREGFVEVAHLDLKNQSAKTKAVFEREKIEISKRRLALLEKRASQADQAEGIARSEASAEEKALKMRALFGIA